MKKIDIEILKSLLLDYGQYILILVLSFFLFRSCQGSNELKLANDGLKKEVKTLIADSNKYVAQNNALNDKLVLLEKQKQKVKKQIVYIEKQTESEAKKVPTLNTKQIANYYQERYKLPITITQYGVSLSDTIAKRNITELIQKDGCFSEIKLVETQLELEEKKGILKDTIIGNITKSNIDLHKAVFAQDKIIENAEKSLRKEKRNKTFWKVTSGIILAGAGYLLITQ